jgi:hypothetical protein
MLVTSMHKDCQSSCCLDGCAGIDKVYPQMTAPHGAVGGNALHHVMYPAGCSSSAGVARAGAD